MRCGSSLKTVLHILSRVPVPGHNLGSSPGGGVFPGRQDMVAKRLESLQSHSSLVASRVEGFVVWTQIPVAAIMAVLDCGLWEGTGLSV